MTSESGFQYRPDWRADVTVGFKAVGRNRFWRVKDLHTKAMLLEWSSPRTNKGLQIDSTRLGSFLDSRIELKNSKHGMGRGGLVWR